MASYSSEILIYITVNDVRIYVNALTVNIVDIIHPIVEVSPSFGTLSISIDGDIEVRDIYLPDGIKYGVNNFRIEYDPKDW